MVSKARDEELRVWRLKERRDAYLNVLKFIELDLRRQRYERQGKQQKLAEVEKFWPKGQRVQMNMEATIGVQVFGSAEMRRLAEAWPTTAESDDYEAQIKLAEEIRQQVRRELWPEESGLKPPGTRTAIESRDHDEAEVGLGNSTPENHRPQGTTRAHCAEKRSETTAGDEGHNSSSEP